MALLVVCFLLVTFLAFSLVLKMKTLRSSETSLNLQRTGWRYFAEGITLQRTSCFTKISGVFFFSPIVITPRVVLSCHHVTSSTVDNALAHSYPKISPLSAFYSSLPCYELAVFRAENDLELILSDQNLLA
jgi:hypothetical protein